jgi:hypothetical protein
MYVTMTHVNLATGFVHLASKMCMQHIPADDPMLAGSVGSPGAAETASFRFCMCMNLHLPPPRHPACPETRPPASQGCQRSQAKKSTTASTLGAFQHLTGHHCTHHRDVTAAFWVGVPALCVCESMDCSFGVAIKLRKIGLAWAYTTTAPLSFAARLERVAASCMGQPLLLFVSW